MIAPHLGHLTFPEGGDFCSFSATEHAEHLTVNMGGISSERVGKRSGENSPRRSQNQFNLTCDGRKRNQSKGQ